jgi:hypothetical protein
VDGDTGLTGFTLRVHEAHKDIVTRTVTTWRQTRGKRGCDQING